MPTSANVSVLTCPIIWSLRIEAYCMTVQLLISWSKDCEESKTDIERFHFCQRRIEPPCYLLPFNFWGNVPNQKLSSLAKNSSTGM
jgi:hypothetical protein